MTDWREVWERKGRGGSSDLRTLDGFCNPDRFNACQKKFQR